MTSAKSSTIAAVAVAILAPIMELSELNPEIPSDAFGLHNQIFFFRQF